MNSVFMCRRFLVGIVIGLAATAIFAGPEGAPFVVDGNAASNDVAQKVETFATMSFAERRAYEV